MYALLERLRPVADDLNPELILGRAAELPHEHGLTVYDACYFELAMRRNAQLATLDKALIAAANRAGVRLFGSSESA